MWKIVLAFIAFAALALFMLSRGSDIDMSGEKHGGDATHAAPAAAVASEPATPALAASAPTAAASK